MAKRPFSMNYQTYDDSQGRGSPSEWRAAFASAMNIDEARRRVGRRTPELILGIAPGATWDAIKAAYRAAALACHPDRVAVHGLPLDQATETFKELTAAFTVLAHRYRRA